MNDKKDILENMPKWFRIAKKASQKSQFNYRIGAVLVKGGSVLDTACNEIRYRQVGSNKYSKWKESLHAERAVISKLPKEDVKGCSIYIWRQMNYDDVPGLAKPCSQCAKLISDMGIKKVFYTTSKFPYYEEVKL